MTASEPTVPACLVLFDGACGLCDRFVRFVLRRDHGGRFHFAPLQGETAARLLGGTTTDRVESLVVLDGPVRLVRARAVLFVLARLPPPWRWLAFLRIVPAGLADAIYDVIARHRHRLSGRRPACRAPTPAERARLLE